eukprot:SM000081S22685  [mRNA]  locus=s81:535115:537067:- [translate_table: standard]
MVSASQAKPCELPGGEALLSRALKNKIDYCREHGIDLWYSLELHDPGLNFYWAKYPLLANLMRTETQYDWFIWMDSDAIFTNMTFEIPFHKYDGKNFVVTLSTYEDDVFVNGNWLAINAGIFLIRRCQWAFDFMDTLMRIGRLPAGVEYGKIFEVELPSRPKDWDADDQSAITYLIKTQKDKWMPKIVLEREIAYHGYWKIMTDGFLAMDAAMRAGANITAAPLVAHYVGCKLCDGSSPGDTQACFDAFPKAYTFAHNQILRRFGLWHKSPNSYELEPIHFEPAPAADEKAEAMEDSLNEDTSANDNP